MSEPVESKYIERLRHEAALPVNPHRPGTFDHADVEAFRAGRHWTQQPDDIGNHPY